MTSRLPEVQSYSLIPGGLLASLIAATDPVSPRDINAEDLATFGRMTPPDIINYFVSAGRLTPDETRKLVAILDQYANAFQAIQKRTPDLASVTGCDAKLILQLARALFSARLVSELLEILAAPPTNSRKRSATV